MSNSNILSVGEMIDLAFGEEDENVVNFKLIQTVMYILARQLRLLERKVGINMGPFSIPSTSSFTVTEVKMTATLSKKKKATIKPAPEKTKGDKPESASSTTDKSSTSGPRTSLKPTTEQPTSGKESSEESKRKDYHQLLENIEQQRERELRIVNQRADSREEEEKAPTPMASLDSMEKQVEKLLIVERGPAKDTHTRTGRPRGSNDLKLSIVTKDQFDNLAQIVKELQDKFSAVGKAEFPNNVELMQDLRKGASLTDAMAALQLSARIDATEETLKQMMALITDLAVRQGIEIAPEPEKQPEVTETKVIFDAPSQISHTPSQSRKSIARKHSSKSQRKLSQAKSTIDSYETRTEGEERSLEASTIEMGELSKIKQDWINVFELDDAMREVYDSLIKTITNITNKTAASAESALKLSRKIEEKLNSASDLQIRMTELETVVSSYAAQINTLDMDLSSQMTNYQEQLTQMQHDLEAGIESMAEALANTGGDPAAVAELNLNFTNLQIDFDATNMKQNELKENQEELSQDLQSLWKQIELLRGTKSDREEVADALRDKAGLGALNGLVTQQQFDAVSGDLEKRIGAAYDKFNNQEIIWQKAIDDLLRELNEKADLLQVISLRDDINDNLEILRKKIKDMMEIVGEPRSAAVSRKLFRDAACLSCSAPAHMDIIEANIIPSLPALPTSSRPPAIGTDVTKPQGDGDHGVCYPGKPIPHPRDLRSHFCQRYCGGSHTRVSTSLKRAPAEIIISTPLPQRTTGLGSDGKVYLMDKQEVQPKPCLPCNFPEIVTPKPSEIGQEYSHSEYEFDTTTQEILAQTASVTKTFEDSVSVTPPPPFDDD